MITRVTNMTPVDCRGSGCDSAIHCLERSASPRWHVVSSGSLQRYTTYLRTLLRDSNHPSRNPAFAIAILTKGGSH